MRTLRIDALPADAMAAAPRVVSEAEIWLREGEPAWSPEGIAARRETPRCGCGANLAPTDPGPLPCPACGAVHAVGTPPPWDPRLRWSLAVGEARWVGWVISPLERLDLQLGWLDARERPEWRDHPAATRPLAQARVGADAAAALDDLVRSPPPPLALEALPGLHRRIAEALATNAHTPTAWLTPLAQSEATVVARALLARPDLPPDARRALWSSPDPTIRLAAAAAETTPEALEALAGHPDPWLRAALADRAALPAALWDTLARDPETRVRSRVAHNPAAAPAAIRRLRRDRDARVQAAARAHPGYLPTWWERWLDR